MCWGGLGGGVAAKYELPVGVCLARFGAIPPPNNNLDSERQKAVTQPRSVSKVGYKYKMPILYVREKARQARIAHKVLQIPRGARGRHVQSGKLIMTQHRGERNPERTSVSKAQKMRRWMQRLREREHTQTASF